MTVVARLRLTKRSSEIASSRTHEIGANILVHGFPVNVIAKLPLRSRGSGISSAVDAATHGSTRFQVLGCDPCTCTTSTARWELQASYSESGPRAAYGHSAGRLGPSGRWVSAHASERRSRKAKRGTAGARRLINPSRARVKPICEVSQTARFLCMNLCQGDPEEKQPEDERGTARLRWPSLEDTQPVSIENGLSDPFPASELQVYSRVAPYAHAAGWFRAEASLNCCASSGGRQRVWIHVDHTAVQTTSRERVAVTARPGVPCPRTHVIFRGIGKDFLQVRDLEVDAFLLRRSAPLYRRGTFVTSALRWVAFRSNHDGAVREAAASSERASEVLVSGGASVMADTSSAFENPGTNLLVWQRPATIVDSAAQIILAPWPHNFCQMQARIGDRELVETAPRYSSRSRHVMLPALRTCAVAHVCALVRSQPLPPSRRQSCTTAMPATLAGSTRMSALVLLWDNFKDMGQPANKNKGTDGSKGAEVLVGSTRVNQGLSQQLEAMTARQAISWTKHADGTFFTVVYGAASDASFPFPGGAASTLFPVRALESAQTILLTLAL
ncbi:hypothetical protein SVAN01_02426 [Stagonosporopsis vannaccii]|nr:hypothetical protein SVAN01_02426 [Stagonosporopsis vannaccii]